MKFSMNDKTNSNVVPLFPKEGTETYESIEDVESTHALLAAYPFYEVAWPADSEESLQSMLNQTRSGLKIVFKQTKDGNWFHSSGWKVTFVKDPQQFNDRWVLYSPSGKAVRSERHLTTLIDAIGGEWFTYEQRTGRTGQNDMDLKFGPGHFPEGTIFEIPEGMSRNAPKQLTVAYIELMGARNYCLVTRELNYPDVEKLGRGEVKPFRFNICHVRRVVKRGTGKVRIDEGMYVEHQDLSTFLLVNREDNEDICRKSGMPFPELRKDEHAFMSVSTLLVEVLSEMGMKPDNMGKWIDEGNFIKQAKKFGFLRSDNLYGELDQQWTFFFIINIRKMKEWFKKNQHRLFYSLDYSQKEEERDDEKNMRALMWN